MPTPRVSDATPELRTYFGNWLHGLIKVILAGDELFGVAFDFRKCFDMVPHGIFFGVLTERGLSNRILLPMFEKHVCFAQKTVGAFQKCSGVGVDRHEWHLAESP